MIPDTLVALLLQVLGVLQAELFPLGAWHVAGSLVSL